nr:glutaredoxin 1 [Hymenolepis microstoma]
MGNLFKSGRSSDVENFVQEQIKSAHVVMFVKKTCPYCTNAMEILRSQYGPNFTENDVHVIDIAKRDDRDAIQDYLNKITGARTPMYESLPNPFFVEEWYHGVPLMGDSNSANLVLAGVNHFSQPIISLFFAGRSRLRDLDTL